MTNLGDEHRRVAQEGFIHYELLFPFFFGIVDQPQERDYRSVEQESKKSKLRLVFSQLIIQMAEQNKEKERCSGSYRSYSLELLFPFFFKFMNESTSSSALLNNYSTVDDECSRGHVLSCPRFKSSFL